MLYIDKMSIQKRTLDKMKELGLTQEKVAQMVSVKQPSFNSFLHGKVVKPKYLPELAKVLGVSYDWLLTGIELEVGTPYITSPPKNLRKVPIIGWVHAGDPMEAIEHLDPDCYIEADFKGRPNAKALEIQGNSMNMVAPEGTIILFDPDENNFTIPNKYYIIRVNNDEAVFRKFTIQEETPIFIPCSTENEHPSIEADANVSIIGRVFQIPTKNL